VPAADATASASRPPRAAACLSAADSGLSDPSASLVVLIMDWKLGSGRRGMAVRSALRLSQVSAVWFSHSILICDGRGEHEPRSSSFSFIQLSKISLRGII
jgi:hypothetical protein